MDVVPKTSEGRIRLPFLDGLRGLCALYVVIFHMFAACQTAKTSAWTLIFSQGHMAVTVFIVLSGFSLMLPVSKSGRDSVSNLKDFFVRRARRILPPYYAALAIFALRSFVDPRGMDRSLFWPSVLSHLAMVHNLNTNWTFQFDGPMWSVATEWDIYFLFPLLLLPLRSKAGSIAAIIAGFAFGFLAFIPDLSQACFWYVGSFAVGMLASDIAFGAKKLNLSGAMYLALWVLFWIPACWLYVDNTAISTSVPIFGETIIRVMISDILGTFGAASLLLALVAFSRQDKSSGVSFLSWVPIEQLGLMSYSLYLLHKPIVVFFSEIGMRHGYNGNHLFLALLGTLPIILGITYVFHLIFERPFMRFKSPARETPPAKSEPASVLETPTAAAVR